DVPRIIGASDDGSSSQRMIVGVDGEGYIRSGKVLAEGESGHIQRLWQVSFVAGPTEIVSSPPIDFLPGVPAYVSNDGFAVNRIQVKTIGIAESVCPNLRLDGIGSIVEGIVDGRRAIRFNA